MGERLAVCRKARYGTPGLVYAVTGKNNSVQAHAWSLDRRLDFRIERLDHALSDFRSDPEAREQLKLPLGRVPGKEVVSWYGVEISGHHPLGAILNQEHQIRTADLDPNTILV